MKEYFNITKIQEYSQESHIFVGLIFSSLLLFASIGAFISFIKGKKNKNVAKDSFDIFRDIYLLFFSVLFFVLFIFFIRPIFGSNRSNIELNKLKETYNNGNYEIVEGIVSNFDPMPYGGHKQETFDINGIEFSYSDYGSYNGYSRVFRNTRSHGGPIYAGAYVKIFYIHDEYWNENFIIGLWVKDGSATIDLEFRQ
jgi:hypothetical protein